MAGRNYQGLAEFHASKMRGQKREARPKVERATPTDAALRRFKYRRAGMAYRRIPYIEQLNEIGKLTEKEFAALSYYADQANLAERSPVKSNLDRSVGGGNGPGAAITSAILETGRIERDLGQLLPLARAIAVDDRSLTDWCIEQHGGRERYDKKGRFVAIVPVNENKVMRLALLELKYAAGMIVK